MQIFNTLTRQKEEFVPQVPGEYRIYVCGPTVYNYIHIGNARPLIALHPEIHIAVLGDRKSTRLGKSRKNDRSRRILHTGNGRFSNQELSRDNGSLPAALLHASPAPRWAARRPAVDKGCPASAT